MSVKSKLNLECRTLTNFTVEASVSTSVSSHPASHVLLYKSFLLAEQEVNQSPTCSEVTAPNCGDEPGGLCL